MTCLLPTSTIYNLYIFNSTSTANNSNRSMEIQVNEVTSTSFPFTIYPARISNSRLILQNNSVSSSTAQSNLLDYTTLDTSSSSSTINMSDDDSDAYVPETDIEDDIAEEIFGDIMLNYLLIMMMNKKYIK